MEGDSDADDRAEEVIESRFDWMGDSIDTVEVTLNGVER